MSAQPLRLRLLLERLAEADIDYVLDVLQGLPRVPAYPSLDGRAQTVDIDGLEVRVCSLEDLLDMERASDRPRDKDDLEALEAARGGEPEGGV